MKELKLRIYQVVFYWAIKKWRNCYGDFNIHKDKTKVSLHAKIRYIERIEGYDYKGLPKRILTPDVQEKVNELGGTGRFVHEGIMYVFDKHELLTVYKPEGAKQYITKQTKDGTVWSF